MNLNRNLNLLNYHLTYYIVNHFDLLMNEFKVGSFLLMQPLIKFHQHFSFLQYL
jgi:hypothetical protein